MLQCENTIIDEARWIILLQKITPKITLLQLFPFPESILYLLPNYFINK